MTPQELAIASEGVSKVFEWSMLVGVLVVALIAMAVFCSFLVKRLIYVGDKTMELTVRLTETLVELKCAINDMRPVIDRMSKDIDSIR